MASMKTWSWMRAWVWGVWGVDEPEEFESALQCSAGAAQRGYPVLEELLIGDVGVERVEVGDGGEVALWIFAAPPCGVFAGATVSFHCALANKASWLVFHHLGQVTAPASTGEVLVLLLK